MDSSKSLYNSAAYKRSRAAYAAECAFEYFVSILVGDAFLAKLLTEMGLKDSTIGIISSFISVAFLFQLASLLLVRHTKNVKRTSTFFNTLSSFLFMCLYLLPFLPTGVRGKTVCASAVLLSAYFCNYIVTSMLFKWGNSFVEPTKRGTYSAGKEMLSLVSGIVFTLVTGHLFDRYEARGDLRGGFLFMASAIFVITLCNLASLLLMQKEEVSTAVEVVSYRAVLDNTLRNRDFRHVALMDAVWRFAYYMTIGFMGVYKTKELLLTVGLVQVINMAGNLGRFSLSMPLGKFANKYGFAKGLELGYGLAAVGFLIGFFCAPGRWWLIIPFTIFINCSLAGINQNSFNIMYSYVKTDYFVHASAIKNSISGLSGFVASLVGSRVLEWIQTSGNTVFGITLYGQQLLSGISFLLFLCLILYAHFVVSPQKALLQ